MVELIYMRALEPDSIAPERPSSVATASFLECGQINSLIRDLSALAIVGLFFVHSLSFEFQIPRRWRIRKSRARLTYRYARWIRKVLGWRDYQFDPQIIGANGIVQARPQNLRCWLRFASERPTNFIVGAEWRGRPLIGLFCVLSGSLFLHRKGSWHHHRDLEEIQEGLLRGFHLVEVNMAAPESRLPV